MCHKDTLLPVPQKNILSLNKLNPMNTNEGKIANTFSWGLLVSRKCIVLIIQCSRIASAKALWSETKPCVSAQCVLEQPLAHSSLGTLRNA